MLVTRSLTILLKVSAGNTLVTSPLSRASAEVNFLPPSKTSFAYKNNYKVAIIYTTMQCNATATLAGPMILGNRTEEHASGLWPRVIKGV